MSFITIQFSSKGGRTYNEDSLCVLLEQNVFFAAVADGLGMHGGGDIASGKAVEEISRSFKEKPVIDEKAIVSFIEKANQAILDGHTADCQMKSTIVALFSNDEGYAVAHMGDSRLYHFTDGRLDFQTVDHSVSQAAAFSGKISTSQIRFHEDRNRVLRALGVEGVANPQIIISTERISERDVFLLCSDGFWEYVWETEMEIDLAKSEAPETWIANMLARVGKRINGKNDNLSAVAIFYFESEEKQ